MPNASVAEVRRVLSQIRNLATQESPPDWSAPALTDDAIAHNADAPTLFEWSLEVVRNQYTRRTKR